MSRKPMSVVCFMVVATLLFWGPVPIPAHAGSGWRSRECRYQTLDGHFGWTVWEVKRTIHCAAARFGISESMALFVADHESHFSATAGGSYCGVYQHDRGEFPDRIAGARARWPRYAWYGKACENARSNIFAAFDLVKDTGGWYDHWCRWASYC